MERIETLLRNGNIVEALKEIERYKIAVKSALDIWAVLRDDYEDWDCQCIACRSLREVVIPLACLESREKLN